MESICFLGTWTPGVTGVIYGLLGLSPAFKRVKQKLTGHDEGLGFRFRLHGRKLENIFTRPSKMLITYIVTL